MLRGAPREGRSASSAQVRSAHESFFDRSKNSDFFSSWSRRKGRTFSINPTKNPSTLVSEAKRVAKENNATFRGDTNAGSFSGKGVKGRYNIEGRTVNVTITDKPTLASWSTVESKVKEFFR